MSDPIKLKVSVDGAAEAKKDIDSVVSATAASTKATGLGAAEAVKAVAAEDALIKAKTKRTAADVAAKKAAEEAAAALAAEDAAQVKAEASAKRAADAIERLALAKGKSAAAAAALADDAYNSVAAGKQSPGAALQGAKNAFSAEAAASKAGVKEEAESVAEALRQVNLQNEAAEKLWAASGEASKTAGGKFSGAGQAARAAANFLFPDMLVSRGIAGFKALSSVVGTLGPIGLAAGGALAVGAGAAISLWLVYKNTMEATYKSLDRALDGMAERIRNGTRTGEAFRENGVKIGETSKDWDALGKSIEKVNADMREGNDEQDRRLAVTLKNIELEKKLATQQVERDAQRRRAAATTDEERQDIDRDRAARIAGINARGGTLVAREQYNRATQREGDLVDNDRTAEFNGAAVEARAKENRERQVAADYYRKVKNTVDARLGTEGFDSKAVLDDVQAELTAGQNKVKAGGSAADVANAKQELVFLERKVADTQVLIKLQEDLKKSAAAAADALKKRDEYVRDQDKALRAARDDKALAAKALTAAVGDEDITAGDRAEAKRDAERKRAEAATREAEREANKNRLKPGKFDEANGRAQDLIGQAENLGRGVNPNSGDFTGATDRQKKAIMADLVRLKSATDAGKTDGATKGELGEIAEAMRSLVADLAAATRKPVKDPRVDGLMRDIAEVRGQLKSGRS